MKNTVLFPPKSRQIFKAIFCLSVLLGVVFGIATYAIVRIADTNLDGRVTQVTGTCTNFGEEGLFVKVNGEVNVYKDGPLHTTLVKNNIANEDNVNDYFKSLVGKEVSFCIPQNPYDDKILWMLSLTVDGVVVATTEQVFADEEEENRTIRIVFTALIAVCAATACVSMILRVNTPALKEYDLTQKFAEHFADRQPLPKQVRLSIIFVIALCVPVVAFTVVGICSEVVQNFDDIIFLYVLAATSIVAIATVIPCVVIAKKNNVKYYADKFPFDFSDADNYPLIRKKDRAEFQKALDKFKAENPDTYADGGNLYSVKFTDNCLQMFDAIFDEDEGDETLEDIFAEAPRPQTPAFTIDYDKLNWQAVPFYGLNHRPLTVVIRSRLQPDPSFPEQFTNDIQLLLEKDLVESLHKFNVQVEGLEEILQNKAELLKQRHPNGNTRNAL